MSLELVPPLDVAGVRAFFLETHVAGLNAFLCFLCSFPPQYPREAVTLRLSEVTGLPIKDSRQLSKLLHQQADEHAGRDEVCAFDVVDFCQEWLRDHNLPKSDSSRPDRSLWHAMLQRAESEDRTESGPITKTTAAWTDTDTGGLFAGMDEDSAQWQPSHPPPPIEHQVWGIDRQRQERQQPTPQQEPAEILHMHNTSNPTQGNTAKATGNEPSTSMVEGVLSAMRSRFSAFGRVMGMLPPSLHRMLDVAANSQSDSEDEIDDKHDKAQLRRDLLVGHLLALVTGKGALPATLPPHALSALAAHLASKNLLPRHADTSHCLQLAAAPYISTEIQLQLSVGNYSTPFT